jgi:hypothetical protein
MDAGQFGVRAGDGMDAGVEATQDAVARCPVDKPRNPTADFPGRMPGKRGSGVAFSFGYFSLIPASCPPPFGPAALFARAPGAVVATQEKSDSVAAGDRPLCTWDAGEQLRKREPLLNWVETRTAPPFPGLRRNTHAACHLPETFISFNGNTKSLKWRGRIRPTRKELPC